MAQREPGIVPTKLTAPRVPAQLVARPRLLQRLSGHPGRLVLVSAPAGFGKTVVVVDWLAGLPGPRAWVSIDRLDNDPTRFLAHLAAAYGSLNGAAAARAASIIRSLGQSPAELPASLLAALEELGCEPVIVLDDVHELDAPAVLSVLERLITQVQAGPRLVLLSRMDPPLPLGRLRVTGDLLELRERDLRFTREEAAELLSCLLPSALEPALLDELERRTEGWVAGLRMAAIALQDAEDPGAVVASFAGTHRFVVEYLLEEAVERQSEAVQRFLMDTSILGRFTPETCAAITDGGDPWARLQEVEAANLFLVPLGDDRRWFRYHHLFAELLQFRLRRLRPERLDVLHERASRWFEAEGDVHEALEHASRMREPGRLLELLDAHGMEIVKRSELASFERWLARVPAPLTQPYPLLLVAVGWLRVLTERAPDLNAILEATAAALERVGPDYDPARRRSATLQLGILEGFAARFGGRLEAALESNTRLEREIPAEDAFGRGLVLYNLARTHMTLGDMRPAAGLLERCFDDNLRAKTLYLVLTGLGQAGAVRLQTEGVHRAREGLRAAVAFAEQRDLTGLPAYAGILYQLGFTEYYADELDQAEAHLRQAVALSREGHFPEGFGNGLVGLVRVATARGRFDEAEKLLQEATVFAQTHNVVLLDTSAELEQARLALIREQRGAGPPAAPVPPPGAEGRWTSLTESWCVLALWSDLAVGHRERAAQTAARLRRECEPRGRGLALCSALFAEALLPEASGDGARRGRAPALEAALQLSLSRGYLRPILEGGERVRPLLESGLLRGLSSGARAHARVLLARLDAARAATRPDTAGAVELTDREREALALLCRGLSNKAIARAMYVSGETVKTHLKHLYDKLGVQSRREAIQRAQALRLDGQGPEQESGRTPPDRGTPPSAR